MIETFAPELRLIIALCRYPQDAASSHLAAAIAVEPIDWATFEALVERHRVAGIVSSNIRHAGDCVPVALRERLAATARRNAAADLRFAAETARLQDIFDAAGFPVLFLKGVTVGMLAYGRLGLKQSWDIDLLTSPESMIPGLRLLESEGYRLVPPFDMPERTLLRFARFTHELILANTAGVAVELHWRMLRPHILADADPFSGTQMVSVAGREVRTLRDELLFAFLVSHGQGHGWSRIKWLADLAALLAKRDVADIERLYGAAQALGTGRSASAALLLCADLMGLALSPELRRRCEADPAVRQLLKADLACIAHPVTELRPFSRPYLALAWSGLRREPGFRSFLTELGSRWTAPLSRAKFPSWLDFAWHGLRLPLWLVRQGRGIIGQYLGGRSTRSGSRQR